MIPWNDQFYELFECVHSWYHAIFIHVPYLGEFPPTKTICFQLFLISSKSYLKRSNPPIFDSNFNQKSNQKLCLQHHIGCVFQHKPMEPRDLTRLDPRPKTLKFTVKPFRSTWWNRDALSWGETASVVKRFWKKPPVLVILERELSWLDLEVLTQPDIGILKDQRCNMIKLWIFFRLIWSNLW